MPLRGIFLLLLILGFSQVSAQDVNEPATEQVVEVVAEPQVKPLSQADITRLENEAATFDRNLLALDDLESRLNSAKGLTLEVVQIRFDRRWIKTLRDAIGYATFVADRRDDGFDTAVYEEAVIEILKLLPQAVAEASDRIASRAVLPDVSKSAADQAAIDQKFFAAVALVNETNRVLLEAIAVARRFDLDVAADEAYIKNHMIDTAKNASVYLDIAKSDVAGLKASTAMLPEDAELRAQLQVAEVRVKQIASAIQANLDLMATLNIETAEFKQQLVTATGEITSSVFEFDVVRGLAADAGVLFLDTALEKGPDVLFKIILFAFICYVFLKLSKLVRAGVERALNASDAHISRLLRDMILAISGNLVIFVGLMIALSQLGLSLGPLLTGLGIAGFIVGFALQDSLSNFASGLMILFYRPFDVNDTIEAAGVRGRVSHMSLVNTTILTFDNQRLIIPNNKVWQDVIINVTYQTRRRIDMEFGITYDQDIDEVFELLLEVVNADDRVLEDPEADVKVGSFGDSSVNILCRPWVKTADYWNVYWDLNKQVKHAFDARGIEIPFPQRDVHIYEERLVGGSDSDEGKV